MTERPKGKHQLQDDGSSSKFSKSSFSYGETGRKGPQYAHRPYEAQGRDAGASTHERFSRKPTKGFTEGQRLSARSDRTSVRPQASWDTSGHAASSSEELSPKTAGAAGRPAQPRKKEITAESLAQVLIGNDLSEIEYEEDGRRIYMSRCTNAHSSQPVNPPAVIPSQAVPPPNSDAAPQDQDVNWRNHPGAVRSPMVGVAYMSPEPGAEPFVRVGSMVSPGQILLLIEAMKVLNPIKASTGGKVVAILAHDQKPVEYNEPLLVIVE
ncbi:MAG: hypothetical protein LBF66_02810 [Holosporales bacterium]|jgi:acetyl-CoA carboxylase biotin carboxyl carrier protein|nr:hypothetical protein [Holosporales bacterium]